MKTPREKRQKVRVRLSWSFGDGTTFTQSEAEFLAERKREGDALKNKPELCRLVEPHKKSLEKERNQLKQARFKFARKLPRPGAVSSKRHILVTKMRKAREETPNLKLKTFLSSLPNNEITKGYKESTLQKMWSEARPKN